MCCQYLSKLFSIANSYWISMFLICTLFAANVDAATLPTLPTTFDTTYAAPTGNVINVNAGGDLQAALNSAQLGDTIVLQAGAVFTGPFTLPNKTSGSGWIYIQSSAYSSLPAPGERVRLLDAINMPKIQVANIGGVRALSTSVGAHHYRFVGIEIRPVVGSYVSTLIQIGNGDTSTATMANNIVFDRCYIHGDSIAGGRRGVAMDGKYVAVIDSYVDNFWESGADSQGLWAYNTPGPLKIVNNYIMAGAENVMFGGADNVSVAFNPSDIEIRNNHFFKPLSWIGSSTQHQVKNLLEFKNATRVLVTGNRFENIWPGDGGQAGWAVILSPRNQDGSATWSVVKDITVTSNYFVNCAQGLRVSGHDGTNTSQQTVRVLWKNNILRITGLNASNTASIFGVYGDVDDLTIDHNTAFLDTSVSTKFMESSRNSSEQGARFTFTNNIGATGSYGFKGDGTSGLSTLTTYFNSYAVTNNAIVGGSAADYPSGNFYPTNIAALQMVNYLGANFRLASGSPYKNAGTDGLDLGANDALSIVNSAGVKVTVPQVPGGFSVSP